MTLVLTNAIIFGVIILYGCLGEILMEKAGHLNLGIPGIMSLGMAGGYWATTIYVNSLAVPAEAKYFIVVLLAILGSSLFSALGGLIYAFFTVTLRCNQNITGLALTTLGAGFADFFISNKVNTANKGVIYDLISKYIPAADKTGWFGSIFLSHGILVYLGIAIACVFGYVLKRTRLGLNVRAVGESPATADAAGINVTAYKYGSILIGCIIAGLGGFYYLMTYVTQGSFVNTATIESYGWLAIALVVFCLWRPGFGVIGSILFGGLTVAVNLFPGLSTVQAQFVTMLPYLVTVIVLIITSVFDSKNAQPPASLGLNYFREER